MLSEMVLGYLEKLSFRPISSLCSKFNPRNIRHMPAVKFFACLDLERKSSFFKAPFILYKPVRSRYHKLLEADLC